MPEQDSFVFSEVPLSPVANRLIGAAAEIMQSPPDKADFLEACAAERKRKVA